MKTQSKAELALCCAGVSNPLFSSPRQFVILISQSFSNAGLPTIPASQSAWNNWLAASGLLTFFEGAKEPLNLSEVHLPPAGLSPDLQERKKKRSQQLDLTKELQRSRNGREKLPLPQYLPMWTVSLLNVTQSLLWSASGPLKTSQWNWALHLMERPFWLNKCISIKKKSITEIDCNAYTGAYEKKGDRECKPFIISLQMHAPQRLNCGLIICSSSSFTLALAEGSDG